MGAFRLLRIAGLLVVAFAIIATACRRTAQQEANWRPQFAAAALKIPFDNDRPPLREKTVSSDAVIPDSIANLRIASARMNDTGREGRLIFRITSEKGYSPLGIAPGVNYVWSDLVNGKTRLLVIPRDPKHSIHWLNVLPHSHDSSRTVGGLYVTQDLVSSQASLTHGGGAAQMALRACACTTQNCSYSWCNGCDTSASAMSIAVPVEAMRRYFLRNNVPWPPR